MGGKRTAIRERYGRLDVGYMTIKAALLAKLNVLILGYSSFQSYSKREFQGNIFHALHIWPNREHKIHKIWQKKTVWLGFAMLQQYCGFWLESFEDVIHYIVISNNNKIQNFHWINIFVARGPKAKKEKSSETKSSNMLSLSSWVFSYQCLDPLPHRQGICPKKTSLCLFSNSNISN